MAELGARAGVEALFGMAETAIQWQTAAQLLAKLSVVQVQMDPKRRGLGLERLPGNETG